MHFRCQAVFQHFHISFVHIQMFQHVCFLRLQKNEKKRKSEQAEWKKEKQWEKMLIYGSKESTILMLDVAQCESSLRWSKTAQTNVRKRGRMGKKSKGTIDDQISEEESSGKCACRGLLSVVTHFTTQAICRRWQTQNMHVSDV